jgi:hypothetical protein
LAIRNIFPQQKSERERMKRAKLVLAYVAKLRYCSEVT